MPKRKLGDVNGPARSSDTRKLSMHAVRLSTKFDHGVELISRGLKIARGFERQKLSRREKTAKSQDNSTTLARLAEEVDALKALDYHVTAERYLFKQLSKTKRIAESSIFQEFAESKNISQESPKSTAESNILARLFKSNPVKNVLPDVMAGIRKLLGLEETPAGKQSKPETNTTKKEKDAPSKEKLGRRQQEAESESASEEEPERTTRGEQDSRPEKEKDNLSISEEDGSDEGGDFSRFDARLASGSDDDSDASEDITRADNAAVAADDIYDSVSRSPSPSSPAADSPPPKKTKASKVSAAPAQSTTFLPSLMMGGYWSGSESEATDDEETAGGKRQRKNRMGQQARRALWEKKYGQKANHVRQESQQQRKNKDSGWDVRRGAVDSDLRGGRGGGRGGRGGFSAQSRRDGHAGSRAHPGKNEQGPPKDTGPLHPSWEAKRKAKDQANTAAFQGKKVTFD
ncbi:Bud-site selection protein BUD22 [Penicillium alfredii]|uniref:Bud-site selection protein BUD22 n=1 Tax=Penicillium alfredii TaxID=1506179 RepID=A0A9W9KGI2_9EURO|nr:Bud-site selection protein BUD22 [Penicillium alfredii]KAJ5105704.1 Bud-site selection protein BUD22 [Penicillium alfredii]